MRFRKRSDTDFQAEIEAHIRLEVDRLISEGMTHAEAHAAARRAFGNVAMVQETHYESQRWMWWNHLGRDLRYGFRLLRKSPVFTMSAALTIALGVGANTAVFRLVDAILLQSLAVQSPQNLVFIESVGAVAPSSAAPYPCLARLPDQTGSFTGLAVFATDELRIEMDGRREPIFGQVASGNYFELLGLKPVLGWLMDGNDENLNPPIAAISDSYWQRRFNRNPNVLGKSIKVDDRIYTIAGITPPKFLGLEPGRPVDVTVPIDTSGSLQTYKGPWWFSVIARLKPRVSASNAQAAANVAFQSCMSYAGAGADAALARSHRLELHSAAHGMDTLRRRFSGPLFALMAIVVVVLLLATVNVANLLLARGIGRRGEFAIRLATGASRSRLMRQLLAETLLLFALGAIPGIVLSGWAVGLVTALFAQGRRPITLETNSNWHVLAFSIAVTLTAALLCSLFPVWRVFRIDTQQSIKEAPGRTSESRGSAALMRVLVGFQVALSLVLLGGAITFSRTLANLRQVDLGFRNEGALTMSIELPPSLKTGESIGLWNRVLAAARETPGVSRAALCAFTPLSGRDSGATPVRSRGYRPANLEDSTVRVNHISDGYFESLGIRLLRGRLLSGQDREDTLKVAVINESSTRYFFGERDPIGQTIEFPKKGAVAAVYRIVGVVGNSKHNDLREPSPRFVFIPIRQPLDAYRRLTLVVAPAAGKHAELLKGIRNRLATLDPELLISEVITIRRQLDSTLLTERLLSELSAAFGILALILASVGLYGVLSYRIGQQRQSIGIQMALGASPSFVAFSVLRQSAAVIAAGIVCGMPFAFMAERTADSLLWGVKSSDPTTYLIGAAVLSLVGLVGALLPARRASAIEPAEALRHN